MTEVIVDGSGRASNNNNNGNTTYWWVRVLRDDND
jgi:hypothetical protein